MADVIAKLQVDSSQYDQRLKSAIEQMAKMEQEVRRTGATFAYADKEEIAFIQSLGSMETKTSSAKSQLREYTEALTQMTSTYRNLTQEEKNSDWGKALAASMEEIKGKAAMLKDAMSDVNLEISGMASDTQVFDQIAGGVTGLVSVFQVGQGAMQMFGVKSNEAMQAMAKLQGAMAVANGLTKVQAMLQKESAVMIGIATVQKKAAAAAESLDTKAKAGNIVVTKAATVAQAALNAVAYANPFVLLAMAVIGVGAALVAFSRRSNEASESQKKLNDAVGSSMGEMVTSYTLLQNQWEQLSTEQEKNDWIKKNADEFAKLGVAINDVSDAEKVFRDQTGAMLKSFELRAKVAALQSLAEESYKDYYTREAQNKDNMVKAGDTLSLNETYKASKGAYDKDDIEQTKWGGYKWTEAGAQKMNAEILGNGKEEGDAYLETLQNIKNELDNLYKDNGLKKAESVQVEVEPVIPEGSIAALEKQLSELQKAKKLATSDEERGSLQKQIEETQNALDKLNGKRQEQQKQDQKQLSDLEQRNKRIQEINKSIEQLNTVLATSSDENERAWATQQLKKYESDLDNLNGKVKKISETPITFSANGISALGKQIKDNLSGLEIGSGDYLIAASNLLDFNTFENLLKTATEKGLKIDNEWFASLFEDIKVGADVAPESWNALVDSLNKQLEDKGLPPIKLDVETGNITELENKIEDLPTKFELVQEAIDKMSSGVSAISTIGNAFNDLKGIGDDLASAFSGEMDTWDALMTVFNSGISIMQTVISVMEAINTLQELSSTLSKKKVADQAAETTAVVTGKSTEAASNLQEAGTSMTAAGANAAESSSAAGKAVAGIPIVGPILAVAAIAAVLAATFAAMSKAKSAGKFAQGGIIPGNSFSGDNQIASVNAGELILSRSQQATIAGQLQGTAQQTVVVEGRISGKDILLSANNTNRAAGGSRGYYTKVK